jgi:hypothetical protein
MKKILSHISLLLMGMTAVAQGPSASVRFDNESAIVSNSHEPETVAPAVTLHQLSHPDQYFPEAAEYAFSVNIDPAEGFVTIRVNAAPAPAHARITDEDGNLIYFAPHLELDHGYRFATLPSGTYILRLDTDEGLPAGSYRIVCP